jgi:hypothetical protein
MTAFIVSSASRRHDEIGEDAAAFAEPIDC